MIKKFLIALLVLIVIVGGGLFYLWSNLDHLIKVAVEKYGTAATQTSVSLDSVKLSLTSGQGSLSGLSVANPKGFTDSVKAFYLGSVALKVDASSIRGTGPIIIREIDIEKPQVNYEITGGGDSNLSVIQNNAEKYADNMSSGKKAPPAAQAAAKPPSQGGERKVIINDLYIRNGQVGITAHLLNQTKTFSGGLPEIHLSNIGKSSGGATFAEVAQEVFGSLTAAAGKVATIDIGKNLGALKDMIPLKGAAGDSLTGVGNQVKGLLGN